MSLPCFPFPPLLSHYTLALYLPCRIEIIPKCDPHLLMNDLQINLHLPALLYYFLNKWGNCSSSWQWWIIPYMLPSLWISLSSYYPSSSIIKIHLYLSTYYISFIYLFDHLSLSVLDIFIFKSPYFITCFMLWHTHKNSFKSHWKGW